MSVLGIADQETKVTFPAENLSEMISVIHFICRGFNVLVDRYVAQLKKKLQSTYEIMQKKSC